jgi:hypothetical protein
MEKDFARIPEVSKEIREVLRQPKIKLILNGRNLGGREAWHAVGDRCHVPRPLLGIQQLEEFG